MLTTHRCVVSVVQTRLLVCLCQQIAACMDDVAKWMGANCLQLNVAKTEFLRCSSRQRMHQLPVSLVKVIIGRNSVHPASVVRDLGVWIDRGLSMSTCYQGCRRVFCYTVLRQLNSIRRSVSRESLIGLVVSLVLTRLDYCNTVIAGLPAYQLDRLQSSISACSGSPLA